ncbi:MAG: SRPBCC domain-containing protein [Methylococcales bacterium]|nr:SRPBCC domain-containing protein [Methylococcales bacterium]
MTKLLEVNMIDIIHRIGIKSPATQVYEALTSLEGLAQWWTEEVTGDGKAGGKIKFTFRTRTGELRGTMVMEVKKLDPQKEVRWRCVDGPDEWIGTDITFQLSEQDNQTIILFGHRNWREAVEFTYHCSTKWAIFLLSLREYVETGKGKPAPHDLEIDNWD